MSSNSRKYAFFSHTECEYFPCHKTKQPESFNCLFCYCPLYHLGADCGGNFTYLENGIKNCQNCLLPHSQDGYDYVTAKLKQLKHN